MRAEAPRRPLTRACRLMATALEPDPGEQQEGTRLVARRRRCRVQLEVRQSVHVTRFDGDSVQRRETRTGADDARKARRWAARRARGATAVAAHFEGHLWTRVRERRDW